MRMRWKNVVFCKDKRRIKKTYYESFSKKERMSWTLMLSLSCTPTTKFRSFYDDEKLCGFIYYGALGNYVFVMFFAVDTKLRSRGYGSKILAELRTQYPNRKILVTIDPPSRDGVDIKTRRKQFYIRNGFKETGYYIKSFGNEQEILLSGGKFSKVGFSVFLLIYSCFAIWPRIEKHDF